MTNGERKEYACPFVEGHMFFVGAKILSMGGEADFIIGITVLGQSKFLCSFHGSSAVPSHSLPLGDLQGFYIIP